MLMFLINAVKAVQHSIFILYVQFEPTGQSVAFTEIALTINH